MKNSKFPSLRSPAAFLIGIGAAALLTGCSGRDDFPGDLRPIPSRLLSSKSYTDEAPPVRKVSARKEKPVVVRATDRSVELPFEKVAARAPITQQTAPIVYAPKEAPRPLAPSPEPRVVSAEPPFASVAAPRVEAAPPKPPSVEVSPPSAIAAPTSPQESRPTSSGRRSPESPAAAPLRAVQPVPATPQGIAAVIDQAESYLRIGNFQSARAVLDPLVKAKNPDALAELGKTYDPIELQKFLVPPGIADPIKATEYYAEAARLGSAIAKSRLERLNPKPLPPVEKQR